MIQQTIRELNDWTAIDVLSRFAEARQSADVYEAELRTAIGDVFGPPDAS